MPPHLEEGWTLVSDELRPMHDNDLNTDGVYITANGIRYRLEAPNIELTASEGDAINLSANGRIIGADTISSSLGSSEAAIKDQLKQLIRETVEELLEDKGFIIGKLPDEKDSNEAFDKLMSNRE